MKKGFCLLLAVLLVLLCAGCGGKEEQSQPASAPGSSWEAKATPGPTTEPAPEPTATAGPAAEQAQELGQVFEPELCQYVLYDYHGSCENGLEPAAGLSFRYGWTDFSISATEADGRSYPYAYGFGADNGELSMEQAETYGYFLNSAGEYTELWFSTRKDSYYGGSNYSFEPTGEYTAETYSGQELTVTQGILWQTPKLDLYDPKQTKTEDGTEWYGYYAEAAVVSNNGHEICIWLEHSDKDGTYLGDIFKEIL